MLSLKIGTKMPSSLVSETSAPQVGARGALGALAAGALRGSRVAGSRSHGLGRCAGGCAGRCRRRVARGGGEPLSVQGARKKRILKDLADSSTGNLFEGPGTRPADFREVVMHSLWVLEDWGRLRAGRIVIETLGEISHVAVSSNVMRHHLPSAAAPKQRAQQAVRRVRFCARTGHNSKV